MTFATKEEADAAIAKTDGSEWMGRTIRVNPARRARARAVGNDVVGNK